MNPNTLKNITYIAIILCIVALLTLFYKSIQNKRREQLSIEGIDKVNKSIEDSLFNTIEDNLNTNIAMKEISSNSSSKKNDQNKEVVVDNSKIQEAPVITTLPDNPKPDKKAIPTPKIDSEKTQTEKPQTQVSTENKSNTSNGYSVIAGSFSSQENAQNLISKLKALGFEAFSKPSGTLFKVYVGTFNDKSAADEVVTKLKAKGIVTIVRNN
jgi:cell division septation protein DedD